jgi:hypothetical protein
METRKAPRPGEEWALGAAACFVSLFIALCAAFACHAVMEETYDPLATLRSLGIFIADILSFCAALFLVGAACLAAFAATGRKRAALLSLIPLFLGPLLILGVYLLFRLGV